MINWFKNLKNKKRLSFVVFDIVDVYASITPDLLRRAINYAKQFVSISDEDINIIMQSIEDLYFLMTAKRGGKAITTIYLT